MRILLIEDEPRLAASIAKNLRAETYAVDVAGDGVKGEELAAVNDYDVIPNLIENAIKYSSPGSKVHVTLTTTGGFAVLTVKDSGAGIPPEDLPLIFRRFHRGASARTSNGGSGLGLAIAQRIVELHQGTITVESEIGRGSSFTVSLPVQI